jgi:hypothetical protein
MEPPPSLCCRAQRDPRNRRNALLEARGELVARALEGRDIQALGAYFWRIFFRRGDDERSPSMKLSGDGWSFMARRRDGAGEGASCSCSERGY